jgi:hypothetical protein
MFDSFSQNKKDNQTKMVKNFASGKEIGSLKLDKTPQAEGKNL